MSGLIAGQPFGKYSILRQLGRGGMGVVYLVEDTTLGRLVALKVLNRSLTEQAEFESRFLREARTVASLQHPNIVPIYALERIGDFLAIEMPFVDGGSLAEAMERPSRKRSLVVSCMGDVLAALARCHAEGIVHRDVKPSNVLIRSDGVGLLSDFGLAKTLAQQETVSLSAGSSSAFFLGTPRYAPPESWEGEDVAPTWDVYSSGMVLYEAFAPNAPYSASTLMGLVKQVIETPIPLLAEVAEGVSGELSDAVAAMLHKDPAKRPEDASSALELLREAPEWTAFDENGARAIPLHTWKRKRLRKPAKPPFRLRRKPAVVSALLILFAVSCTAFVFGSIFRPGARMAGDVSSAPPTSVAPYAVFDTFDPGTGAAWPCHLLLLASEDAEVWTALAFESTQIWLFDVVAQAPGIFRVTGNWAGYSDRTATLFQHGEIIGSARWTASNVEMTASLEFRNLLSGNRQRKAFVLKRSNQTLSDVDYVNHFAASDFGQVLLYNEVMPRRLAWGRRVEDAFLARAARVVAVPELGTEDGVIVVDGDLSDEPWPASALDSGEGPGVVGGEGSGAPRLFARRDGKGLYLGFRAPGMPGNPHLRLAIMPRFDIPVRDSSRWSILANKDGIKTSRHGRGDNVLPWRCAWQVAMHDAGPSWQSEVFVPFGTAEGVPLPVAGERWRVNCSVTDGSAPGSAPVAMWGERDAGNVQNGMILVFGAP